MSTKVGRNDSCPCGSGKKYKKCCLAKDERERREQAEYDARWTTEVWYPKPSDLQLPDVPESLRPEARLVLGRALPLMFGRGIGVRAKWCWQIAQALTHASDGAIGYVEGVWTRSPANGLWLPNDEVNPVPHAWNSFGGHIIDLMAEFYNWNSFGEDSPWLHEPLTQYSPDDLEIDFFDEDQAAFYGLDDFTDYSVDVSSAIWLNNGGYECLPEHLKGLEPGDEEFDEYVNQIVFKNARERLLARLNQQKISAIPVESRAA